MGLQPAKRLDQQGIGNKGTEKATLDSGQGEQPSSFTGKCKYKSINLATKRTAVSRGRGSVGVRYHLTSSISCCCIAPLSCPPHPRASRLTSQQAQLTARSFRTQIKKKINKEKTLNNRVKSGEPSELQ